MRILATSLRFTLLVAVLGGLVGYVSHRIYPAVDVDSLSRDDAAAATAAVAAVASTLASVAATMLGFIIAALAILASVANMRLLRNMQRTGHYQVLLFRLLICALAFGLLLVFSVAALFVPVAWPVVWSCIFGTMAAAAATFLDSMRKFVGVLLALRPAGDTLD